jgi:hypothetical protein
MIAVAWKGNRDCQVRQFVRRNIVGRAGRLLAVRYTRKCFESFNPCAW